MRGHSEATSAIRTKPLRTYTPGFESRDGEGSHVPFEMANLFRAKNKDPWKKIKSSIDSFGLSSEMFKEISIKSFGLNTSDPFQIQFSSDGPKTNIVDLGYGTSQVVPIIYSVAVSPANSLFLIQQPEVHLHPKAQAALGSFFVDSYVDEKKEFILETHSDFIVDRIRNAILQGRISRQDVSILFFERRRLDNSITEIALDDKGFPTDPPEQYRAFFIDEQLRIMGM
jgi:predicted ATPase